MDTAVYYTRHSGGISLYINGKPKQVVNDHPNFSRILDALNAKDYKQASMLMNIQEHLTSLGVSKRFKDRKIFVKGGKVYFEDTRAGTTRELHGTLVKRIMSNLGRKTTDRYAEALLMLEDNIQKNKLKDIRAELYEWLMSGNTPITYDGCFLAYKRVQSNYLDFHSSSVRNKPGDIPRMKQDDVNRDRTEVCSVGYHFCSKGYLPTYHGGFGRIVIVKVNPRHVFAIPVDHNFQKGRASEYFVAGELNENDEKMPIKDQFIDSFIDEDSKAASAPDVTFVGNLRPSLEMLGKSYGLIDENGVVRIIERRGKYLPVTSANADVLGTPVDGDVKEMSFKTKSVRQAVKAAILKAERGFVKKAVSKR